MESKLCSLMVACVAFKKLFSEDIKRANSSLVKCLRQSALPKRTLRNGKAIIRGYNFPMTEK